MNWFLRFAASLVDINLDPVEEPLRRFVSHFVFDRRLGHTVEIRYPEGSDPEIGRSLHDPSICAEHGGACATESLSAIDPPVS